MRTCLSLLFTFAFFYSSFAQEKKPYNVLFIAIDDLNDYVSLLQDYPGLKTPNLDKFAKTAITFNHAYTPAPACNPARAAILSGISPVKTGIYENGDHFQSSEKAMAATLLPEHFKANGYTTMWSGKIFHTSGQAHISRPGAERMKEMWDDAKGHDGGYGPRATVATVFDNANNWFNYEEWEGPDEDFPDIKNGDITIKRLQKTYEKPFFMAYGLYRPHNPWTAPKRFFDMYPLDEVRLPEVPEDDLDDIPAVGRQFASSRVTLDELKEKGKWKHVVRSYLASISFMDYSLGRVLDALDNSPHRDNTIVVLWSDHGFHMGEKEHFTKFALWEQTTHVLAMARIPGVTKGREARDQPVNLLDLYPTLVDYCNLSPTKHQLDGMSLRPVIEDESYKMERPSITYFKGGSVGMRSPDWRYIRYYDGTEELYNSHSDPREWKNLANDSKYDYVKAEFIKWLPEKVAARAGRVAGKKQ